MKALNRVLLGCAALFLLTFAMKEARGGNFIVLKEGTPVAIKLTEAFDAGELREGGKVPMAVAEKVMMEGYVLIEAGAPVEATYLPAKDGMKTAGFLEIASVLAADGQDMVPRAAPEARSAGKDGVAVGRLSIPVPEEDIRMPAGTTFKVYLADSYFIEE